MAVEIKYNGSTIASLESGQTATLKCKSPEGGSTRMLSDIIVTVPEDMGGGGDSPLPIEVSTEAEMTALIETAEVGSIYKYTGETTDTYENGALYVVEEEEVKTYSLTVTNDGSEWLSCIVDKTELPAGELATVINSGEAHTFENVSSFVWCSTPYGLRDSYTANNCTVEFSGSGCYVYPTGDNATVTLKPDS